MPKGKPYTAEFKAKVTPEALQGARTVSEIASAYELNPNMVRNWKAKAEPGPPRAFSLAGTTGRAGASPRGTGRRRAARIARPASPPPSATAFSEACLRATGSTLGKFLVDPASAEVSAERQCELLGIFRSTYYYYKPRARRRALEGEERERAMRVIDEARLEMSYVGARKPRVEPRECTGGETDFSRPGQRAQAHSRAEIPCPNKWATFVSDLGQPASTLPHSCDVESMANPFCGTCMLIFLFQEHKLIPFSDFEGRDNGIQSRKCCGLHSE